MTVTLTQAATTYLNDIASSVGVGAKGYDYIKAQGRDLLVLNIGMTPEEADDITADWLRKHTGMKK